MREDRRRVKYNYGRRMISILSVCFITVSALLTGCAFQAPEKQGEKETENVPETLGLAPVFEYELPHEMPSVQINQDGYLTESTKIAVFQGEELPESFRILKKESDECVYVGEVRYRGKDNASGLEIGHGNFSDFQETGDYYIQCEKIGCSYYFKIGEDIYLETAGQLKEALEAGQTVNNVNGGWQTDTEGNQDTVAACETLSYLLLAYENYPGLLTELWSPETAGENTEAAGIAFFETLRAETDWLLSMQDEKTGGIYGGIKTVSEKPDAETQEQYLLQEISETATASFAGTMAKYSYLYQQYDWDYATICLKAAGKAWKYLEGSWYAAGRKEEKTNISGRFYAAAELYRASNEARYHNYILQNQELILNQNQDFYLIMGETTYLSTRRKVDDALCGQMMGFLMEKAEVITEKTKENLFLAEAEDMEELLWNMTIMSVVDYAITNQEYSTVIENNLHYLLGRNRQAEILLDGLEIKDTARVLLMLSVVMAEKDTEA